MNIESLEMVFRKADGTIIDVREPHEYKVGHLYHSNNIPKNELLSNASYLLDKSKKYYLICRSGKRSLEVAESLNNLGYKTVSIAGGLDEYERLYQGKTGVVIGDEIMQLRYVKLEDAHLLNKWWNDGKVMQSVGYPNGLGQTIEETQRDLLQNFASTQRHHFIIDVFSIEQSIGECNYKIVSKDKVEVGIKIGTVEYQRKGYAKRALNLLFESIFSNEEFTTICLTVLKDNLRAQELYKSLGFKIIQVYEDSWEDATGEAQDVLYLELTRKNYENE